MMRGSSPSISCRGYRPSSASWRRSPRTSAAPGPTSSPSAQARLSKVCRSRRWRGRDAATWRSMRMAAPGSPTRARNPHQRCLQLVSVAPGATPTETGCLDQRHGMGKAATAGGRQCPVGIRTSEVGAMKRPPPTKDDVMGEAADDPAFLHVIRSQVGLPYSEVHGRDYIRRTGRASLVVSAGFLIDPHTGEPVLQGVPYGAKPRVLMLHLCTQ